jgi:hypothetical protein
MSRDGQSLAGHDIGLPRKAGKPRKAREIKEVSETQRRHRRPEGILRTHGIHVLMNKIVMRPICRYFPVSHQDHSATIEIVEDYNNPGDLFGRHKAPSGPYTALAGLVKPFSAL